MSQTERFRWMTEQRRYLDEGEADDEYNPTETLRQSPLYRTGASSGSTRKTCQYFA